MFEEIYLEADEEVTSAIDKIKKSKKKNVVLVLPRGAMLGQSIVNLKLVYKEAASAGKEVALVTSDTTTQNLAERIGFMVYDTVKKISFAASPKDKTPPAHTLKDDAPIEKEVSAPIKRQQFNAEAEDAKVDAKVSDKESSQGGKKSALESSLASSAELASAASSAGFITSAIAETGEEPPHESAVPESEHEVSNEAKKAEESSDEPDQKQEHDHASADLADVPKAKNASVPAAASSGAGSMIPTRGNLRFFRQQKRRTIWLPIIILGVLILFGLVAAVLLIPSVKVTATVQAQPFKETVKTSVDVDATTLDVDKAIIPGKILQVEQVTKSSAKTSGKKDIGTKASGTITLTNEWDSQNHTLPSGTTVKTRSGKEFTLDKAVVIPGASSTLSGGKVVITPGTSDAAVTAAAAGTDYNVPPSRFTIPSLPASQQDKIYGISSVALTGGTSNVVTIATESDIAKLTDNIKGQNKDEALAEIKKEGADRIIIDSAIQTVAQEATPSVQAGDQADTVEVSVKGTFHVITFTKQDQDQLLQKVLANKIPDGQTLVTQEDGLNPDISNYELNLVSEKRLELTNNLKAFTVQKFDPDVIRRSLIGAEKEEVQTIVSRSLPVTKVDVALEPSQWPLLPYMQKNITLVIVYTSQKPSE